MVKKKIKKKSLNKKETIAKENFLNTLKKYKGFTIALIFFIIIIIFFFYSNTLEKDTLDDIIYSRAMNEEINNYLNLVIEQATIELNDDFVEELDKYYLESIIDDMYWLKEKNNELLETKNNVLIKMFSYGLFLERILLLNEEFSYDFLEPDYDLTIKLAREKEYSSLELILEEDLYELTPNEKKVFKDTINSLGQEYFEYKKNFLGTTNIKRQYVEAKKIIFLIGD